MLFRAEEFDGGFENLARNSDVRIQEIESFSEIWRNRITHMLTEANTVHQNALSTRVQNRKVIKPTKNGIYFFYKLLLL